VDKYMIINEDAGSYLDLTDRVKCIFMDPPDNVGLDYHGYRDKLPPQIYYNWMELLIGKSLERSDVVWISYASHHELEMTNVIRSRLKYHRGWNYRKLIWRYTFGQYRDDDFASGFRCLVRLAAFGSKLYPDAIKNMVSERMLLGDKRSAGLRLPDDVWEIPRIVGNSPERRDWHPTQHPRELMNRIILISCAGNERILDLFGGTGTTLRECLKLGIPCTHVDISNRYCQLVSADTAVPVSS
jgi:DNA modification methylase